MYSPDTGNKQAPELEVDRWFNSNDPPSIVSLRGRVVLLWAFQMLCPGCVMESVPLVKRIYSSFDRKDLAVIGLHTVFEHHDVMTPDALAVFLHEYRIPFPVAVDQPSMSSIPKTMEKYRMQGTPTLVVIDAGGQIRSQYFGMHNELLLGAQLGSLITQSRYLRTGNPSTGRSP